MFNIDDKKIISCFLSSLIMRIIVLLISKKLHNRAAMQLRY